MEAGHQGENIYQAPKKGKKWALLRQINNPIGGVDYGLFGFLGIGIAQDKTFGFASCPSDPKIEEGVNVLLKKKEGYSLSNLEYCMLDRPFEKEGEEYLANTNLLFVKLSEIESMLSNLPFPSVPGMLVNCKELAYQDQTKKMLHTRAARLESTMQNLADGLIDSIDHPKSFITKNKRKKTISAIKESAKSTSLQTPLTCLFDILENGRDLLENYCNFSLPKKGDRQGEVDFFFQYHPALGPLYSVICQKLQKGTLAYGSELNLQIAALQIHNLCLDGSLHIVADAIMGSLDGMGKIEHGKELSSCTLQNVCVVNKGVDWAREKEVWKGNYSHKQKCLIHVGKGGEFVAKDVVFSGEFEIRVPKNTQVTAQMDGDRVVFSSRKLKEEEKALRWSYTFRQGNIKLENLGKVKNLP